MANTTVARVLDKSVLSARERNERRERAFTQMNDHLRAKAQEMEKARNKKAGDILEFYWQEGAQLVEIRNDPATYHVNSFELLADYWVQDKDTLRHKVDLHLEFTEEEVKKLAYTSLENGLPITMAHAIELMRIKDKSIRLKVQQQLVNQSLTREQLSFEVNRMLGGHGPRQGIGGRPQAAPKTPFGMVSDIDTKYQFLNRRCAEVWEDLSKGLLPVLESAPQEQLDETFVARLDSAISAIDTNVTKSQSLKRDLLRARQHAIKKGRAK